MLATGFVVLDRDPAIADLRRRARALLEQPPSPTPARLTWLRYMAATHYEDALDILSTDPEGAAMILSLVVYEMLRFPFLRTGRFLPRDKDLLTALQPLDPQLASLGRQFYAAPGLADRLRLAEMIAARSIQEQGFFEWESDFEEIGLSGE
jgi:hypothetical protein